MNKFYHLCNRNSKNVLYYNMQKRLIDIIKEVSFAEVRDALLKWDPKEEDNLSGYEEVFNGLQEHQVSDSRLALSCKIVNDDPETEPWVDVSGYDAEKDEYLGIEFTPWDKWLGMTLTDETVDCFTKAEIVAEALYEMTFFGFAEDSIKEQYESMCRDVDACIKLAKEK